MGRDYVSRLQLRYAIWIRRSEPQSITMLQQE